MAEIIELIDSLKRKMSEERGNLAENHAKLAALENEAIADDNRRKQLESLGNFAYKIWDKFYP